jgi:sensor histidine kinase YesM
MHPVATEHIPSLGDPAVRCATRIAGMTSLSPAARLRWQNALAAGFRFSWTAFVLIVLINTGIAAVYWIEDPRPFWHPLVTVQCHGLAIAYCVNAAAPWASDHPLRRLSGAVVTGVVIGIIFTILLKGYSFAYVSEHANTFALNFIASFFNGVFVSLFFLLKFRETRAAQALHQAEAERHLLAKQAIESELKLMQAQIEPHFLFNTLASVQYLTETDPPQASTLLGHLLAYLRAALPQLRTSSATLGQETELAEAYLNILRMRMGSRLAFEIAVPDALREHPFPPVLLISVVENAVTHGLEPQAEGGTVRIEARRQGDRLIVGVSDSGVGTAGGASRPGHGVGLANVRDRLAALFGSRGRFSLEDLTPHGARATIEVPYDHG